MSYRSQTWIFNKSLENHHIIVTPHLYNSQSQTIYHCAHTTTCKRQARAKLLRSIKKIIDLNKIFDLKIQHLQIDICLSDCPPSDKYIVLCLALLHLKPIIFLLLHHLQSQFTQNHNHPNSDMHHRSSDTIHSAIPNHCAAQSVDPKLKFSTTASPLLLDPQTIAHTTWASWKYQEHLRMLPFELYFFLQLS